MNNKWIGVLVALGLCLAVYTIMLALIGAMFLYDTAPYNNRSISGTCDDIRTIDDRLVCIAYMKSEDEEILITRKLKGN